MARVVDTICEFKILKTRRDFVVVNTKGSHENHSHFLHEKAARNIIDIVRKKKIPKGCYYLKAAQRLATAEDYQQALELSARKDKKNRYFNYAR